MSGGIRRRLAVAAVTVVGVGGCAGAAMASSSFQLSVTPSHVARGGKVTISTTPRMACKLTIKIAKKPFTHEMKYGWTQLALPRADVAGRVPVKVTCAGTTKYSAFTIK